MIISSRTPEGHPIRCVLCGVETNLEFSDPAGDAPCPNCGHLLWLSAELHASVQKQLAKAFGATAERISPDTLLTDLGADSLDTVELVMDLEDEFDLTIPSDVTERLQTVEDAIRYIEQRKREGTST